MNLAKQLASCTPAVVQVQKVLYLHPALLVVKVEEQIRPDLAKPTLEEAEAVER